MENQEKCFKYLESVEKLAQEILADRYEIIVLDKRRNECREALREVINSGKKSYWLTVGSVLIKHNLTSTKSLLEAEQNQLSILINKLRSELKVKVNDLRDLEMQPAVPGLMLNPMTPKETIAMSNAGIF